MNKSIIIFSLLAAYALCGCSGNDSGNEPGPPPVDVRHVTVNSDNTTSDGSIFEPVDGTSFKIDHILYSIVGTHIEIAGGDSLKMGESIEPYASITYQSRNYKVRAVKEKAFYQFHHLKGVTLPEGIQYIGSDAFIFCTSLSKIELPDNIVSIESGAFAHCTSLTEIKLPSRLKVIGSGAFEGCTSLTFINIPEGTEQIGTENEPQGAFNECQNLCTVSLPSTIKSIGENTFSLCNSLESVTCRAITPPNFHYYAFVSLPREEVKLYVPAEAVEAYTKVIAKLYDAKAIKVMPIP